MDSITTCLSLTHSHETSKPHEEDMPQPEVLVDWILKSVFLQDGRYQDRGVQRNLRGTVALALKHNIDDT